MSQDSSKFFNHFRLEPSDDVFKYIDECYARLAEKTGFNTRPGQVDLSKNICKSLVANIPLIAEAPTGTGKTIAYLIGAIAASTKLSNTSQIPIVVSTGTVGLQSQILTGDLPRLVDAGIIPAGSAVIAKGRGRYFCVNSAMMLKEGLDDAQLDIFDMDANSAIDSTQEVSKLLDLWAENKWSGDVDLVPDVSPVYWNKVSADSGKCLGYKCDSYSVCPFFSARKVMSNSRLIIANHDLVLSDLAMFKEEIDPLFPESRYLVVFDEAHHLPDKAVQVGSAVVDISKSLEELPKIKAVTKSLSRISEVVKFLDAKGLPPSVFETAGLESGLNALNDEISSLDFDDNGTFRFPKGSVPSNIISAAKIVDYHCSEILKGVSELSSVLKNSEIGAKNPTFESMLPELLMAIAGILSTLNPLKKGLTLTLGYHKIVRWATTFNGNMYLHNSPAEGAEILKELLWSSSRAVPILVSATIRDFEGFTRFKSKVGAPDTVNEVVLPHIFPYHKNDLYIVNMEHLPLFDKSTEYLTELSSLLPSTINLAEGSLVLFRSVEAMNHVVPILKKWAGPEFILPQRSVPLKQLIGIHKDRIDEGKGSVLCGLATMAEGLDLPGEYCTHVIICGLPFSAPTSPVEQELQEELGKDYFEKRSLPDALIKLIQMVGRLIRRESDIGRITIFDKRLSGFRYGMKMRAALPNFKKKLINPSALESVVKNWKQSDGPGFYK